MSPTGASRITARYPSEPKRTTYLAVIASGPAAQRADREEHGERDHEQQDGERRSALHVVAVDPLEDVERRDLCLEREVARDEDDRAELADRARECERDAGQERRQQIREDDPPKDREAAG